MVQLLRIEHTLTGYGPFNADARGVRNISYELGQGHYNIWPHFTDHNDYIRIYYDKMFDWGSNLYFAFQNYEQLFGYFRCIRVDKPNWSLAFIEVPDEFAVHSPTQSIYYKPRAVCVQRIPLTHAPLREDVLTSGVIEPCLCPTL